MLSSALPVIGGTSLSVSYMGMVMVFLYLWIPFMVLPLQAALERVPATSYRSLRGPWRHAGQTFRKVILPLALPGVSPARSSPSR